MGLCVNRGIINFQIDFGILAQQPSAPMSGSPLQEYAMLHLHVNKVSTCAFSHDGNWLATGGHEKKVCYKYILFTNISSVGDSLGEMDCLVSVFGELPAKLISLIHFRL